MTRAPPHHLSELAAYLDINADALRHYGARYRASQPNVDRFAQIRGEQNRGDADDQAPTDAMESRHHPAVSDRARGRH